MTSEHRRKRWLSSAGLPRRPLWVGALVALVVAALVVAYLLRQNQTEQQHQTELVLNDVCQQTAAFLAGRLRQQMAAAVLDTIESINHVDPARYRLAQVARAFAAGHARHSFVDRFFLWSVVAPKQYSDQVLFFRNGPSQSPQDIAIHSEADESLGSLYTDAEAGRDFLQAALAPENDGRTFVLLERSYGGTPYYVMIHQWGAVLPSREIVGIIGYTIDLSVVRQRIFEELLTAAVPDVLAQQSRSVQLRFTVFDEQDRLVFGSPIAPGMPSGSAPVDLSFFPAEIPRAWVTDRVTPARWRLVVSAPTPEWGPGTQTYLFVAVILLILIAMTCAVAIHRQSARLSQLHADFVANVSHQLRTPLSLLAATSETLDLERVRTPEKVKQYAAVLYSQTARLTRLVEHALRFSRIEAGADVYDLQHVDLVQIAEGAVNRALVPGSADAAVRFTGPSGTVLVTADPIAIEEVLANLLDNAIKYSNGHIDVDVRVATAGHQAVVLVIDRGIGIDATDLPHVFEKYYRGRNERSTSTGFGLGLSIVQEIVRAHRGRVEVDSVPNQGSEFRVFLPLEPGL